MVLQWVTTMGQNPEIDFHRDQVSAMVLINSLVPEINGQCTVQVKRI